MQEMREQVYQFAAGLKTIGVKKGDRLALLAEGRVRWVVAEMGMFYLGAIDVPLSIQLNEPADLSFPAEAFRCQNDCGIIQPA